MKYNSFFVGSNYIMVKMSYTQVSTLKKTYSSVIIIAVITTT